MLDRTSLYRRHSFPPQIYDNSKMFESETELLEEFIELGPSLLSSPLTTKNLEIHTKSFPSTKEARRRSTLLFVESQISLVDMEMSLREKHELEVTAYLKNRSLKPEITTLKPTLLHRLKHFLFRNNKKRQHSKSVEQSNHMAIHAKKGTGSQKRDSGISLLFSHNSKHDSMINEHLVAYRYPNN